MVEKIQSVKKDTPNLNRLHLVFSINLKFSRIKEKLADMTRIQDFLKTNNIPDDFDEDEYGQYIEGIENFWEPYCTNHGITKRQRYYFHCITYSGQNSTYKPPKEKEDNVSVVVGCMDREKMLNISVHSWIQIDSIKEIIITDWSSKREITYLKYLSPKIKIIRVEGKKHYNASTPVNMAIRRAKYEKILKLDTDYIINPFGNFNDLIDIKKDEFISGDHRDDYIDNRLGFIKGLTGFLCVHKENMEKVGYYDESIENYGTEDCQMFQRLMDMGLKRKKLKFHPENIPIYHSPHSNYYRCENFQEKHVLYNYKKYGNPLANAGYE